ncbi:MAG: sigma-54-dependent transcriptional regulator [Planctomycetota bacterium]
MRDEAEAPGAAGHGLVLLIEDEPVVRSALRNQLVRQGYQVEEADLAAKARRRADGSAPALVLLDLQLPDGHGLDLLPHLRLQWPETPVIVMTGHGSIEIAVEAMRQGAANFVQKPINFGELSIAIDQAIETSKLRARVAEDQNRASQKYGFEKIVARSPAMKKVIEQARIVVRESRATTILILGESGTGKGLLASAMHFASQRKTQPFLKVTCSAIPETLLEAELFGHERGAFTDAKERRRGVFEAADGGTVFLDEIGDMPQSLQAKLLGILEDKSFRRIGSQQPIHVDVRIIAATHRDLARAVDEGRFRQDLFYRLNVVPLTIPPLRERREDIVPLARHFVAELNRSLGRQIAEIAPDAEAMLLQHSWMGNVRELRNAIERAMLFASGGRIGASDLFLDAGVRPPAEPGPERTSARFTLPPDGVNLEQHEMELVRQAMERTGQNQSRAAALLGLSRDQIRYRLEKMGLLGKR